MKSEKKLDILVYRSPLKSEREEYTLEYKTIKEIYTELKLENPIQDYFFLDGDTPIHDFDTIPESDKLYIKALFTGEGGDYAEEGGKSMAIGAAMVAVGVIVGIATSWTGVGAMFGVSLAVGGLTLMGSGYYLYTYDVDGQASASAEVKQAPSISGSKNSNRAGQKVPVLLGRHVVYPWFGGAPYTEIPNLKYPVPREGFPYALKGALDDSDIQYIHMLFGNTYEHAVQFNNSIQIGEVPISAYLEEGQSLSSIINFQESTSTPPYYPKRVKFESKGVEIARGDTSLYPDPIEYTFTTAKNTKSAELTFIFPKGLYYAYNGQIHWAGASFSAEWKHVNAPDSSYQPVYPNQYIRATEIDAEADFNTGNSDSRPMLKTCRFGVQREFDNNTPSSSEYNEQRQYTFRIRRTDWDDAESARSSGRAVSTCYLECIKSFVGDYDDVNPPKTWPILPSSQATLNVTSLRLKATDQLSGTPDNVNYEMLKYMPMYTGDPDLGQTGPSYWSYGATRNPASAFLYVLTDAYVNREPILPADLESRIDYLSLETWYTFCQTYELECNNFIVNNVTVEELLRNIVSTAFASWNVVDNRYTVYVDTYNDTVTQLFTPRNSWEFKGSKSFNDPPTGLSITYINSYIDGGITDDKLSEGGFTEEVRYVYADGRSGNTEPLETDRMENAEVFGAMSPDQVWRLGRYMLSCTYLRPEVYSFKADIEHVMCTRWDRIKLQHDVPLSGISSGRISSVNNSGGFTVGYESDEVLEYEVGKTYSVQIRGQDGSISTHSINNPETDSYTVTFVTPIATGLLFENDLFAFGESGSETTDLIITSIEAFDNETATITCVEYNEAIYDAYQIDSGSIPLYTSRVSKGGSSGALTVNTLPESQSENNSSSTSNTNSNSKVDYRATIVAPTGSSLNGGTSFYPDTYTYEDGTKVVYIAYWNGNKIYITDAVTGQIQTRLNEVPSRWPKFYLEGTQLLYIHGVDNHLYLKGDITTNELGTPVYTANNVVGYTFNPVNLNIFVWTDTNVYELDYSDSFSVIHSYSLQVRDMLITDDSEVYYIKNDGFIYFNNLTFSSESLFYNGAVTTQIQNYITEIYFIRGDLGLIYSKTTGDTVTTASDDVDIATSITWGFDVTATGDVVYSNTVNGQLYLATTSNAIIDATLSGEIFTLSFTGDLTTDSNIITDVNNDYIDQLAVGDSLRAVGLLSGTTIKDLGNERIILSTNATATNANAGIIASGDRILLDANKVIIDGSVEANLLSSSAIDSKARASNGEKISEISLDTGTAVYRNAAGNVIYDFNPNRTGNEMIIDGTITASEFAIISENVEDGAITTQQIAEGKVSLQSGEYIPGAQGWKINENGDSEFNSIVARGTMASSSYESGEGWEIKNNGDVDIQYGSNSVFNFDASTGTLDIEGNLSVGSIGSSVVIDGTLASVINSNASAGADAYAGTVNYRLGTAPTNNATPSGITTILNSDGTYDITLSWTYTQGTYPADVLTVFWESGSDTTPSSVNYSSPAVSFNVTTGTQYYTFNNLPGKYIDGTTAKWKHYTFGIAAGRSVSTGATYTAIASPTPSPDWVDVYNESATMDGGLITAGAITSTNFVSGTSGFNIDMNGDAEFNSLQVRGYPLEVGESISISVGVSGDYANINDALTYLSGFIPVYQSGGISAIITMESSHDMDYQVIIDGFDFSWVTIQSGSIIMDSSSFSTSFTILEGNGTTTTTYLPGVYCLNGGKSPTVSTPISLTYTSGTLPLVLASDGVGSAITSTNNITSDYNGVLAVRGGSIDVSGITINCDAGNCIRAHNGGIVNFKNGTITGTPSNGLYATVNGNINALNSIIQDCTSYGILSQFSGRVSAISAVFRDCAGGVYTSYSGFIDITASSFGGTIGFLIVCAGGRIVAEVCATISTTFTRAIYATGGTVECNGSTFTGATDYAARFSGANGDLRGVNLTDGGGAYDELQVYSGSIVNFTGGTGTVNVAPNAISSNGIVFK